jgi:hypothetical protein
VALEAEGIKAFSETDFTEDLREIDVPTLVLHGEHDQIGSIKDSEERRDDAIAGPGTPSAVSNGLRNRWSLCCPDSRATNGCVLTGGAQRDR